MITQLLLECVRQKIAVGLRDEEIKSALRQEGYSEEEIREAFYWFWYFSIAYSG
jgi:hypothetical protein